MEISQGLCPNLFALPSLGAKAEAAYASLFRATDQQRKAIHRPGSSHLAVGPQGSGTALNLRFPCPFRGGYAWKDLLLDTKGMERDLCLAITPCHPSPLCESGHS